MRRHVLHIVSGFCLVACLLLAIAWVRSYWIADRLVANPWGAQRVLVGAKQGRLVGVVFRWPPPPLCAPGVSSYAVGDELSFPIGDARQYDAALGFAVLRRPQYMVGRSTFETPTGGTIYLSGASSATLQGWGVSVPFWFLVMTTGAAALALSRKWRWRFSIRGLFVAVTLVAVLLGLVSLFDKPPKNWELDQPVPLDGI
jgi:hypothetical protein